MFLLLSDVRTDSESEKNIKLSGSLFVMMSKAKSMIIAAALKIEDSPGRCF